MNESLYYRGAYATDETIYLVGGADFSVIAARSSEYAAGTDGVVEPGSWVLTSDTEDFEAQGVSHGMMLEFKGPKKPARDPVPGTYIKTEFFMAVDSVDGHTVTLRRPGEGAGKGNPPGGSVGLTGVHFEVKSFLPQLRDTADELNILFQADESLPYHGPADIQDAKVFRRVTAYRVLADAYATANRGDRGGDFDVKQAHYEGKFRDRIATVVVRWGAAGAETHPPTNRLGMRVSR